MWDRMKNPSQGLLSGITRLVEWCQTVIPRDGFFYLTLKTNDSFFFSHTFHFWKWLFDNAVTLIADVRHIIIDNTVTISDVIIISDVNLNDGIALCPIQPVYNEHMKILDFYLSHGTDKGVWDKIC